MEVEPKGQLQGNDRYGGYSMDLISKIAESAGFQFEFRLVKSNKHADLVNNLIAKVSPQGPAEWQAIRLSPWHFLKCSVCCCRQQTSQFVT
jgi:hypothetical protein